MATSLLGGLAGFTEKLVKALANNQSKNTAAGGVGSGVSGSVAGSAAPTSAVPSASGSGYTALGTHFDSGLKGNAYSDIANYQSIYNNAASSGDRAMMDWAHNQAEQLRGQYGYSGGVDGSDYIGAGNAQTGQTDMSQILAQLIQGFQQQGQPEYPFAWDNYDAFLNQNGYNDALGSQQAAIDAYVKQQLNLINAQKGTAQQDSDALARQAYISNMQSKMNLPQQLSAAGFSGGMADSQMIGLDTTLQNNQNDIRTQLQRTISELEMAAINAQLAGDQQAAEQAAALYQAAISAWNNYTSQANDYAQSDYWNAANMNNSNFWNAADMTNSNYWNQQNLNMNQQQANQSQSQWETGQAYKNALTLLEMGVMPGESVLAAAGISSLEAQEYIRAVKAQQTAKATGSGSSGGSGSGGGTSYYNPTDLYEAMMTSGSPGTYLASNYKAYGMSAAGVETAMADYANWLASRWTGGDRSQTVKQALLNIGYTEADLGATGGNNSLPQTGNNPQVSNTNDSDGVQVPGFGWLTWEELAKYVGEGAITETRDPATGAYTYTAR